MLLLCLVVLGGACILALRSARVQTAAVAVLTDELSQTLQVDAHIEQVDFKFPLALTLKNIYLSDRNRDTLLLVPELIVHFNPLELEKKCLSFPLIQLSTPLFYITQDSTSTNLDFLFDAFSSPSDNVFSYDVVCDKIELKNAHVRYTHLPSSTIADLSDLSSDVSLTYSTEQNLKASLRALHVKTQLAGVNGYAEVDLHGSLDTIFADQLRFVYHDRQMMNAQLEIDNPLSRDKLCVHARSFDMMANAAILTELISDITHAPTQLPDFLAQMGDMRYRGKVDANMHEIAVNGLFITRMGSVSSVATIHDLKKIHANISTKNWNMAHMLNNPDWGCMSAACTVDLSLVDKQHPNASLSANIYKCTFRDYMYSGINMKASYANDQCTALVGVHDDHVQIDIDANVNNLSSAPVTSIDLDVKQLDLASLHLTDAKKQHSIAFNSVIRLHTDTTMHNWIDGTLGTIRLQNLFVQGFGHSLLVPDVNIALSAQGDHRHMTINSSVLTADINGQFQWTTIPATIAGYIHHNLPSLVKAPVAHDYCNNMDFNIQILRPNDLFGVLIASNLQFPSVPSLNGYVHESERSFSLLFNASEVIRDNVAYQNLRLTLDNINPHQYANASFYITQHIIMADSTGLRLGDLMSAVQLTAHNDSVTTQLEFGPLENADSLPDILVETAFRQWQKAPMIDIHVLPTTFQLGTQLWRVRESHLCYRDASSSLVVDSLQFIAPDQMIIINGCMSPSPKDSLCVRLGEVDLGYLLSATKVLDAVNFSGKISGWATLYGAFDAPQLEANVTMPNGTINGTSIGDVTAKAELDRENKSIQISASAVRNGVYVADISGRVLPTKPAIWDLNIDANGLPLSFLNRWTTGILDDVEGCAYGQVHIFGRQRRTYICTRALADSASLTLPFTGCRYFFSDSIFMDTTSIAFPSVRLTDVEGNRGMLSGRIEHSNFSKFKYDLKAQCTNLLGIDLPSSAQNLYYGRVYATGNVDMVGNEQQNEINIDASTAANTEFYLSLATASSASASEFISFKQPDVSITDTLYKSTKPASKLLLNMAVEVRPLAKVHLVLDEHNGDGIVGRGDGNIRFSMDASSGNIQMLGTYVLSSGTFSYTVGNLVHRDFTISEGSTITWSGDATNPQLDITAKYRCTASLRDLFGADVKNVTSRSSIPVDCVVHITGTLNNMILHFGIEYTQSDESVAAQINAVINTESMLMRQVVYLLVFNRFYAPEYMRSDNRSAGLNDAYSLLSSTVTGQINSWLSKLTDMVNVGFNMRTDGEVGNQSYETEANIQIQPVDRLTINGNVGYRYNDLSNQPIFGDADVEYELTSDGKLRAKVFTHSVDKYSLHQTGMQEGVGFIFRHDFNPGDAKKRRLQKKRISM